MSLAMCFFQLGRWGLTQIFGRADELRLKTEVAFKDFFFQDIFLCKIRNFGLLGFLLTRPGNGTSVGHFGVKEIENSLSCSENLKLVKIYN